MICAPGSVPSNPCAPRFCLDAHVYVCRVHLAFGSVCRHGLVACPLCVCTVSVGQVYSGKCYEYDAITLPYKKKKKKRESAKSVPLRGPRPLDELGKGKSLR